jgi:hypothetical protein
MAPATDFKSIRSWRGSQDQAFEELCYQLRDPTPASAELIKTGSPDGGLEWYFKYNNGVEWGWQAKYSFNIDSLLGLMEKSLRTVAAKRPHCRRLTFCIPFDLPDERRGAERKSAREKFEDRKKTWRQKIKGADKIKIDLWSEGDLLERMTNHPGHRGIAWFFWEQEVFSPDWCRKRLDVTLKIAGERYSPELHINLPVAFALEGFGRTAAFWEQFQAKGRAVQKQVQRVRMDRLTGLGVTRELQELVKAARRWQDLLETEAPYAAARLERVEFLAHTRDFARSTFRAIPETNRRPKDDETAAQKSLRERKNSLAHLLDRLYSALSDLEVFLEGPAAVAAETGALLLTGEAGQGKTHLFCDTGERALDNNQPAVVLLGAQFPGRGVWSAIAHQLGLGDAGAEMVIGAMQAAGEASDAPFLLLIDALNEASEPEAWQVELPVLLAEVADNPWISVAVSVRSTFIPIVLPPTDELENIAEVDHPGFEGRELEATERFFDYFGLQQPRIPLLTPEFTNPLFLKLYCEGLKGLGLQAPLDGSVQIGDVFSRYLDWKERRINQRLKFDPDLHTVRRSLEAFSKGLLEVGRDPLPYEDGAKLLDAFAPQLTAWPDTLVGQLLSEGLLTADLSWDPKAGDYVRTLRFTYQRFGDYQAIQALLEPFEAATDFTSRLRKSAPFRKQVREAPAGWIEALSVELPERLGLELLDAFEWRLDQHRRWMWDRALVRSIVSRKAAAVSDRSRQLLSRAQKRTPEVRADVLEGLLAVAPDPAHPLNADYLHGRLLPFSLAHRDSAWSMPTYSAFGSGGPLDRLLRWAGRGPHDDVPDDVVQLAALPIVWTFTSPNRRLRDFATKALVRLLQRRISLIPDLIERFRGVNDPYVMERLALSVYGVILSGGSLEPNMAVSAMRIMRSVALEDPEQIPNILTRDSVRGMAEWCLRQALIQQDEYGEVVPPYQSDVPDKPRTEKQLERAYGWHRRDSKGNYVGSEYGALFASLFGMGDFARYVVEPKVRDFTQYPLDQNPPTPRPRRKQPPDKKKLAELEASLTKEQRALANAGDDISQFVDDLSSVQRHLLIQALNPPPPIDRKASYPIERARAWLFERVLSLGWTPERFDEWEQMYARSSSRSPGSRERFGKKYQWIALSELVARLGDNFHMKDWPGDEFQPYRGPWQFFGRDLDPTLPPASQVRDERDGLVFDETFTVDPIESWWVPPGPLFGKDDPLPPDTWATQPDGIPEFEPLVRRKAPDGSRWVVLQAYYNWDEERDEDDDVIGSRRRDLWSHIKSWLVAKSDAPSLIDFLEAHTLMGNWMPEGQELTDSAYLGEMPWAAPVHEYPAEWREVNPRYESEPSGLKVYPAWIYYYWEGNVLDASIDNGVGAMLPAPQLFDAGDLSWEPGQRLWHGPSGELVAQYRQAEEKGLRHSALLVRESWLRRQLQQAGCSLVVGWLGEKQLFDRDLLVGGLIGSWTEINGIALLSGRSWKFGNRRLNVVDRREG